MFSSNTIYGKAISTDQPSNPAKTPSTSHYYHGNIHWYRSEGQRISNFLDGTSIPQAIPTQTLDHKLGKPYTHIQCKHNLRENHFNWPTLIPSQSQVQATIIVVAYTHIGLREDKYPNFGWYKHTPHHISPNSRSQTGQNMHTFSM